jgi:segregation and condensation protein A
MDDYKIKIPVFEGPMDLLLHLVKINEMDIHDIRIAEVTRQYLDYIRLMETLNLEVAGDFLVMASTLINIKLRSLLPDSGDEESEDEEIGDIITARALMEQLIQYRKFKEAAARMQEREEHQSLIFFREVALPQFASVDDDLRGDLEKMLTAFSRVLRFVDTKGWHLVTEEEYSLEQKLESIQERIQSEKRLDLAELFHECRSKVEMIVVILALLELCRQKVVSLSQSDPYGSVHIFGHDPGRAETEAQAEETPEAPSARIIEVSGASDSPESGGATAESAADNPPPGP